MVVTCYTTDDGTEVEEDIFLDFNEETVFVIGVKGEKWMQWGLKRLFESFLGGVKFSYTRELKEFEIGGLHVTP